MMIMIIIIIIIITIIPSIMLGYGLMEKIPSLME